MTKYHHDFPAKNAPIGIFHFIFLMHWYKLQCIKSYYNKCSHLKSTITILLQKHLILIWNSFF